MASVNVFLKKQDKLCGFAIWEIHMKLIENSQIIQKSVIHNIHLSCLVSLKLCTEHSSITAVLCAEYQTNLEMRKKLWANDICQDFS